MHTADEHGAALPNPPTHQFTHPLTVGAVDLHTVKASLNRVAGRLLGAEQVGGRANMTRRWAISMRSECAIRSHASQAESGHARQSTSAYLAVLVHNVGQLRGIQLARGGVVLQLRSRKGTRAYSRLRSMQGSSGEAATRAVLLGGQPPSQI